MWKDLTEREVCWQSRQHVRLSLLRFGPYVLHNVSVLPKLTCVSLPKTSPSQPPTFFRTVKDLQIMLRAFSPDLSHLSRATCPVVFFALLDFQF